MENLQAVSLRGRNVSSVSCGQQHTCVVIKDKQEAVCWGEGTYGAIGYDSLDQVLSPDNRVVSIGSSFAVQQIQAYAAHTCALSTKGEVSCWGTKKFGRIGLFSLGAAEEDCFGCSKGQMKQLLRLNFGCVNIPPNTPCPIIQETQPKCELCKGWPQDLCRIYNQKCRWSGNLKKCSRTT
jgi:alpha-tubulin suppressor-like RCC1 family protein